MVFLKNVFGLLTLQVGVVALASIFIVRKYNEYYCSKNITITFRFEYLCVEVRIKFKVKLIISSYFFFVIYC